MNRIITSLIMIFLTTTIITAVLAEPYTDPSSTFSIEIPQNWVQTKGNNLLELSKQDENSTIEISKQQRNNVGFESFAEEFTNTLKKETRLKFISFNETEVDGAPAGVWTYSAKVLFFKIKFKHYMIFPKDKDVVFSIVLGSQSKDYDTDVTSLDSLVNSWKWIN